LLARKSSSSDLVILFRIESLPQILK